LAFINKIENRLGFTKKRGVIKMIGENFYSVFYIGAMIVAAVANGIQFGGAKGFSFRRGANIFQMLVFIVVPIAFVIGGQTSAFYFWSIVGFFLCSMIDVIEMTLLASGKLKIEEVAKPTPERVEKRGSRGSLQKLKENPAATQSFSVIFSFLLTTGIFLVSLMLVTGYFFQQ
jgi:hypothetical protein